MARLLYRLGSASARRPLVTLVIWLLLTAAAAVGMAAFSKPMSNEFELPDSEFGRVFDHVGQTIPKVAGGTGTVVVTSKDGFTADQRAVVAKTLADWRQADHVTSTVNPFETQAKIDRGRERIASAKTELEQAQRKFDDGRYKVDQLRWLVNQGRLEVKQMRASDPANPTLKDRIRGQASGEAMLRQADRKLDRADAQLTNAKRKLRSAEDLTSFGKGLRFVSKDGTTALIQIRFERSPQEIAPEELTAIPQIGEQLTEAGMVVDYGQEIVHTTEAGGIGEVLGLVVAAVVLLVMLGSLVMAGLPLITAFIGVAVALLTGLIATHWVSMFQMAPVLGAMLGLAVGIDYSLFIVNRHRRQLGDLARLDRQLTKADLVHSLGMATGTAGTAVGVAGTTVVIALVALTVSGIPTLMQMGLLAAFTVTMMVIVSLTLTPALLSLVGRRAVPKRARNKARSAKMGWPERWAELVTKRAGWAVAAVIVILGIAVVPATQLRLGLPDGGSEQRTSTAFRAYETIERQFGAGANGPMLVVADVADPVAKDEVVDFEAKVAAQVWSVPGVSSVTPAGVSADRRTFAFQVMPQEGPSSISTKKVVTTLRGSVTQALAQDGIELGVTGQTAANIEVSDRLAGALPLYLVLVIGLSLGLLTIVFRSVVVPVLATAGFLLSVAASFGAVVAVYQWAWLGNIFDVHRPGTVMSFMPTLLIGILFGLAMDYQMFLVSGMREAYVHGDSAVGAVKHGFVSGARVVAAAGIIMVSVFGGFIFTPMTMARPIGFGLAVGVLADAFLVRMVLTPAAMSLLGDKAWWMPLWLDRLLPHVDVEGSSLVELDRQRGGGRSRVSAAG